MPLPIRLIEAPLPALLEIVAIPLSGPRIEGVSLIPYWHLLPGASIPGFGQVVCFPVAR